jgi:subtilisin-like proprotein convertase family protein
MRRRLLLGLLVSVTCFIAVWWFWGKREWLAPRQEPTDVEVSKAASPSATTAVRQAAVAAKPFRLLSEPGNLNSHIKTPEREKDPRLAYRISNTPQTLRELLYKDSAVLLENALIDTATGEPLPIPSHLKAGEEPGSYIVQASRSIDASFRQRVQQAGAEIVAYIPNNALLVKASSGTAEVLSGQADTRAVIAFEPYFKLKSALLKAAVEQTALPDDAALNVLLFPQTRDSGVAELEGLGAQVLSEERSPFGTIVRVRPAANTLAAIAPAIARMQSVQGVELARQRISANDISRDTINVSADTVVPVNYLGLSGSNVLVGVNDTGVDTNHPDLASRVFADAPISGVDSNGHGTHVAGIIAGDGSKSTTVTNAIGSIMPSVDGQFRGKAPGSKIYSMNANLESGPASDVYLQEQTRKTNALISNNSWHYYDASEYDLAAASYDAAVRDALPGVKGSQPLLFVFPSGNRGGGDDEGLSGNPDTIDSPGTAKNVITVGATEQYRNVTNVTLKNCTTEIDGTNVTIVCETNTPWAGTTDQSNRVAGFSSRGNVGVGIEGEAGRFKPDVVAPGTFIISTRSTTWDERKYYDPTNYQYNFYEEKSVLPNDLNPYSTLIPYNAVRVEWSVTPSARNPGITNIPIYVRQVRPPTLDVYDFIRTNYVSMPPDQALTPTEIPWFYGIANPYDQEFIYNLSEVITTTNDEGNYFEVLSNINNQLGPFYRYESGTSMSAAQVSGTLALMQEFFEQRLKMTNSPALMKALLINGARSVGDLYSLHVATPMNLQGWGEVNLTNTLQSSISNRNATASSMLVFDQGETNALSTGAKYTRKIKVAYKAITTPLRITLVWTDPPGNPLAGAKLVNNLDLVVTNLDTGDVFYGNDILPGFDFNLAWDTNTVPNLDVVNNVENVYIPPNLGTNYSITVIGRKVNVNAVPMHTNDVVQDYALVISSGDGVFNDSLTLEPLDPPVFATTPNVIVVSNSFGAETVTGGALYKQRIGGNTPLRGINRVELQDPALTNAWLTIGMTNQWNFYVITNEMDYTNAVFATFFPPTLSIPRMGVNEEFIDNATRVEADLDIYVSTNSAITNLSASALQGAFKSISRQGSETVVLTNATDYGKLFYIAVKSESQQGSEYGFLAAFSLLPFSENGVLNTFPNPSVIPDGTPALPGVAQIFGIQPESYLVRRVVVTNWITHQMMGDLMGNLNHNRDQVWLNNHAPTSGVTNRAFIYDDTGETPFALPADGPGDLTDFGGGNGAGQWIFSMLDSAFAHIGTNELLQVYVEEQPDLEEQGVSATINGASCRTDYIYVSELATNLIVRVTLQDSGSVSVSLCREGDTTCNTMTVAGPETTRGELEINAFSNPPLNPGVYALRICNNGDQPITVFIETDTAYDLTRSLPDSFSSLMPVPITDDAVSFSTINVPEDNRLISVEVGLRVDHPRVSDLVFHLTSPAGTRVLLSENRGGLTTSGMGTDLIVTNFIHADSSGGAAASTNVIDTGLTQGRLTIVWEFDENPDRMVVYYENVPILDTGLKAHTGTNVVDFSGESRLVTIIVNPGRGTEGTLWRYTVESSLAKYNYTVFTEDTNKFTFETNTMVLTPIKFAVPPYTNSNYVGTNSQFINGIYYLPEDTLDAYKMENAKGDWKLEVWDNRAGATNPAPVLLSWELLMRFERQAPRPILVEPGVTYTNLASPGQMRFFIVDVPWWASFGTNTVVDTDGPLKMWHNPIELPTGTNTLDTSLLDPAQSGDFVTLQTNATPVALLPGTRYYIGLENPGTDPVTFGFRVDFDVTELIDKTPVTDTMTVVPARYFYFNVTTNVTAVAFKLYGLSGGASLVVGKTAYPDANDYAYAGFNPDKDDEQVNVTLNSEPVRLTSGRWYVGVLGAASLTYTVEAEVYTNALPQITRLFDNQPLTATNVLASGTNDYYVFTVEPNAEQARFEVTAASGDVQLALRKGLEWPGYNDNQYQSANPGTADELLIISTNSTPQPLVGGDWYVTVVNFSGGDVTYTITASQIIPTPQQPAIGSVGLTPSGAFSLQWTAPAGEKFQVEWASNITGPWTPFTTVITSSDGTFSFTDDTAVAPRFYRLVQLP